MANSMLQVQKLSHRYGKTVALNAVSFDVHQGEIFGLLGPNGAGKTTLLSIVSGLLIADSGQVLFAGEMLRGQDDLRRQIGIVPQEPALYMELTARENLTFFGEMYGLSPKDNASQAGAILEATGLTERADDRAGTFSGGMKRRLNLGVALMHRPRLLLMDEPTVGVDPQSRNHIFEEVRRLNREGTTIVYTSHYMEEVQSLCTRIGIMDRGELIACDTLPALLGSLRGQIVLRLEPVPDRLVAALESIPDTTLSMAKSELRLECREVKPTLLRVATILSEQEVELLGLELEEPGLEGVFLHLTGKALRD